MLIYAAHGQTRPQEPLPAQADEVVRINTDLMQVEVTVVDKQGRFVEGLQREQFELRADGNPRPISFFEQVKAGSAEEERLAARGDSDVSSAKPSSDKPSDRGRTIVFFIDDLHLSLQSVGRTRQTLLHFIEKEMDQKDQVAIASASGQIGFLQQFTNNKAVLRAAVSRLNHQTQTVRGYATGSTPMTEYMAFTIETKADDKVFNFYVSECMKQSPIPRRINVALMAIRATCEVQVKHSARSIVMQAGAIIENTYSSLESLLHSSMRLPGRKLAFFISDGFLLDAGPRSSSTFDRLQQITDTARRAGVVIYSIDAKGLVSGALDATNNVPLNPYGGALQNALMREVAAMQDALHALAHDTGGRALRNQNEFDSWIVKALDETSHYYILAWRLNPEEQKDDKFRRIEVSIIGRPDLTARLPRGYLSRVKAASQLKVAATSTLEKPPKHNAARTPEVDLRDALTDSHSRNSLPTLLSLSYLNTPNNGMVLTASMQVAGDALTYSADGKQAATVDLAGVVLNDQGKIAASFKNRLNVDRLSSGPAQHDGSGIIYNHRAPLEPGIYQVRVAARDVKSGRLGSAMQWLEIPNLSTRRLTLSSLLIGGQVLETAESTKGGNQSAPQVQFSVDHRFSRSSRLGFWVFVYNAARNGSGAPELTGQVQVFRNRQAVVNAPQRKLVTEGQADLARIPYGGELPLKALAAGQYELRVTITDHVAKTSASQSIDFEVE